MKAKTKQDKDLDLLNFFGTPIGALLFKELLISGLFSLEKWTFWIMDAAF
jgi:hypothetical protein